MARGRFKESEVADFSIKLIITRQKDGRLYNMHASSEIAALIVKEESEFSDHRDIRYNRDASIASYVDVSISLHRYHRHESKGVICGIRQKDGRLYDMHASSEVAALIVEGESEFSDHCDIRYNQVEIGEGNIVDIGLDYEWIPDKCSFCKAFGHSDAKCLKNPVAPKPTPQKKQAQKPLSANLYNNNKRERNTRWVPKNMLKGQTSIVRDEYGNSLSKEQ
ncbi:hypothetical protein IFM89_005855 [Coptis chinensis]|uniref:DUF4283 domain-containing protein n=1 Tax=Coptis chinensis TaxID=261450 RepID=A0A835HIW0_9MAGN|nr:hypothetical protein IFM89_005855 [Coptis chinensis]